MNESFESAMTLARMIMAECDMPLLDRLQDAHDHELEQTRKTEYHRGYEDGRHSMDAEHYAVALRLRALPLDGGTQENLSQIARAVWHSDFGWTQGACKALRDELVRLLGGVSDKPLPNPSRTSAEPDADAITQYDVLDNERHEAVCRLRYIRDCLKGDSTCNSLNIADAIGAKLDVGDHLHESICDRLIHLLGGDEPTESLGSYLSRKSVDAMSRRADQSHESSPMRQENETGITNELQRWASTEVPYKHGRQLHAIADRIEEQFDRICQQQEAVLQSTISELTAECDELQKRLDEMREQREHWASEATKMYRLFFPHEEYGMPNEPSEMVAHKINELQAKLEEAEFAIANWREREKSFDTSERMRDELRERLKKTEEALSGTAGKLAMAEARLRDARAKLDVLEENGLTLMHRALKNMLGETKSTHDVLRAKVEAMPRFDRERRRLMRIADDSERRCSELLDLLGDAAKEFKALMKEKGVNANGRKA